MSKKKVRGSAAAAHSVGEVLSVLVLLAGLIAAAVGSAAFGNDIFPRFPWIGWLGAGFFAFLTVVLAVSRLKELTDIFSDRLWKHWNKEIGLLTYLPDGTMTRSSLNAISANATRLYPFLTFEVPNACDVEIGFVLVGSNSQQRLRYKGRYTLQPGKNTITPPEWLPLEKMQIGETWTLKVSINDQRMATRKFTARHSQNEQVGVHLDADGQIDEWLSANIGVQAQENLSLSELLRQDPPHS
jgi:hypothetical protein